MIDKFANVRKEGSITIIQIDNPPANALSTACIDNMRSIFHALAEDEETSVIILKNLICCYFFRTFCKTNYTYSRF